MNSKALVISAFFTLSLLLAGSAIAGDVRYAWFGAGRYHADNEFSPVAFEPESWSFLGGLEVYEGSGYWQFAVDYAEGTGTVGTVITPQINLNVNDNGLIGGFGVLYSYVEDDVVGNDWSDVYFQINLGLDMPLGDSSSLIAVAHYVFDDFDAISDFDTDSIDYTAGFNYRF